ncbi:MAG TPA: hypothetical protein V6C99_02290 [Oculatellaceae cyanobacterium]|jgi:uncharacterized protein YnzC (UPF0291/DUF896 family)
MSKDVFAMLLERRVEELNACARVRKLTRSEKAELEALEQHRDKSPSVAHRIRILSAKLVQPSWLGRFLLRFSRQFKMNMAELEALIQYGHSEAVWEIAYLKRKQAARKLTPVEEAELQYLQLYHDSPEVLRITQLKLKEAFGQLSLEEIRELTALHRNLYCTQQIPGHLLELFWPSGSPKAI